MGSAIIFFVVWIGTLTAFAAISCHGLRREVQPTRRRDVTMACADNEADLKERLRKTIRRSIMLPAVVVGGGLIAIYSLIFLAMAGISEGILLRAFNAFLGPILMGSICLLPALPVCWGIIAWNCAQACEKNQDLPHRTEPVAILLSSPAVVLVLLPWALLSMLLWSVISTKLGEILAFPLVITAFWLTTRLIFAFPQRMKARFVRAYPYRE
ncbi:hypothetical protein KQI84_07340 [bacterium]|nr:hypothetical protein [bacterium]